VSSFELFKIIQIFSEQQNYWLSRIGSVIAQHPNQQNSFRQETAGIANTRIPRDTASPNGAAQFPAPFLAAMESPLSGLSMFSVTVTQGVALGWLVFGPLALKKTLVRSTAI
jgi:hypothetical protein